MNVRVTNNDLLLFKYLFECDFLSKDHIEKYVWNNRGYNATRQRLWRLKKGGFIKSFADPINFTDYDNVIAATNLAKVAMKANRDKVKKLSRRYNFELLYVNPKEYRTIDKINYAEMEHNYFVSELRFIFENYGASLWQPENLLYRKKMYNKIPDGTFMSYDGRTFAVELERNLKNKSSYKRIFAQYDNDDGIDFIIYVTIGEDSDMIYNNLKDKKLKRSFYRNNFKDNWISDGRISDDFYKKFYLIKYKDIKKGNLVARNYRLRDMKNLENVLS